MKSKKTAIMIMTAFMYLFMITIRLCAQIPPPASVPVTAGRFAERMLRLEWNGNPDGSISSLAYRESNRKEGGYEIVKYTIKIPSKRIIERILFYSETKQTYPERLLLFNAFHRDYAVLYFADNQKNMERGLYFYNLSTLSDISPAAFEDTYDFSIPLPKLRYPFDFHLLFDSDMNRILCLFSKNPLRDPASVSIITHRISSTRSSRAGGENNHSTDFSQEKIRLYSSDGKISSPRLILRHGNAPLILWKERGRSDKAFIRVLKAAADFGEIQTIFRQSAGYFKHISSKINYGRISSIEHATDLRDPGLIPFRTDDGIITVFFLLLRRTKTMLTASAVTIAAFSFNPETGTGGITDIHVYKPNTFVRGFRADKNSGTFMLNWSTWNGRVGTPGSFIYVYSGKKIQDLQSLTLGQFRKQTASPITVSGPEHNLFYAHLQHEPELEAYQLFVRSSRPDFLSVKTNLYLQGNTAETAAAAGLALALSFLWSLFRSSIYALPLLFLSYLIVSLVYKKYPGLIKSSYFKLLIPVLLFQLLLTPVHPFSIGIEHLSFSSYFIIAFTAFSFLMILEITVFKSKLPTRGQMMLKLWLFFVLIGCLSSYGYITDFMNNYGLSK